ncbi:MAG TPA: preprotein translocase subunit SecE [Candidatus Dojkabacteria bacterium]|nr:preprotein translocase subunit SecE [Candidatus Dojkabacteria bacterium]
MFLKLPKQLLGFIRSAIAELKFISFPTKADTFKLGTVVITTSLVLSILLYFTDWLFQILRNLLTSINI